MKSTEVCEGCKYCIKYKTLNFSCYLCNYLIMTGHSRLVKERQNGGYKSDSCICYAQKENEARRAKPLRIRR